jgi:hypothetical protein
MEISMSQLAQISGEYIGLLATANMILGGGFWWFTRLAVKGLLEWKKEVSDELVETKVKLERHERDLYHITRELERTHGKIPSNPSA